MLACFPLCAAAQDPEQWPYFDRSSGARKLENRFALIASDGVLDAASDARSLAVALDRYGWSVRLFAAAERAPSAEEWNSDWSDLAQSSSELDTVLVAWIATRPMPEQISQWSERLATLNAAHRVLLLDVNRADCSETKTAAAPAPLRSWPENVTVLLANAAGAHSHQTVRGESAADGNKSAHAAGLYLDAFMTAMEDDKTDLNGDDYLSIFECHHIAAARTTRRAFAFDRAQRPEIYAADTEDCWIRDLYASTLDEPARRRKFYPSESSAEEVVEAVLQVESQPKPDSSCVLPEPSREPAAPTKDSVVLQKARNRALDWLMSVQSPEGKWDCDAFPFDGEKKAAGYGAGVHDVGVTGLSILALISAEDAEYARAKRRAAIDLGIRWLRSQLDDEDLLGGRKGHAFAYDHAIGTHALCSALAHRLDNEELRSAAQRAVNTILRARNPYKAWRYEMPPNGENDTSVSTWMTLALNAAQKVGLDIDGSAKDGMIALLDELTDLSTGRCGYISRGEPPARPVGTANKWPAQNSESLTAAALMIRQLLGETDSENPYVSAYADLIGVKPPRASPDGSTHDFVYWYYGARALAKSTDRTARDWRQKLKALLPMLQSQAHAAAPGSFDPSDPWGQSSGRIGTTAYAALALSALIHD